MRRRTQKNKLVTPPRLAVLVVVAILLYLYAFAPHKKWEEWTSPTGDPPTNATLGFGAIVAVSREGSSRREGLIRAANITNIEITIPPQPVWTDNDLQELRKYSQERSTLDRGSGLAWLGHLNALKWFLSTSLSTAFIIEDDVDWDTHLRTTQIPQVAAAIRRLTTNTSPSSPLPPSGKPPTPPPFNPAHYYGPPDSWDILYLGHCGDRFDADRASHEVIDAFPDDTLLSRDRLHPYTKKFLDDISAPPFSRLVHASVFPLCSFGYVVTRRAASLLLSDDYAGHEPAPGCMAYDVRLLEGCRDQGLRCYTANPELFHHIVSPSEIAIVNSGVDEHGRIVVEQGGDNVATPNIKCAARSFKWSLDSSLAYLRQELGKPGRCLKDEMPDESRGERQSQQQQPAGGGGQR